MAEISEGMSNLPIPGLSESQSQVVTAILAAFNAHPAPDEPPPIPPEPPSLPHQEAVMTDAQQILTLEEAHRIISNPTKVINSSLPMWLAKGGTVWHYCSPDVAQAEDWRAVGHFFRYVLRNLVLAH